MKSKKKKKKIRATLCTDPTSVGDCRYNNKCSRNSFKERAEILKKKKSFIFFHLFPQRKEKAGEEGRFADCLIFV